ncbi:pyruvate dehydrogenase (acetyl-transferring) E1 component subunit alpha [Candidatus Berkiella aquae]|uniref:Pyruvate dehydrogenase E1 component subunit alpha n=1 Tax=Candidatus Berkiella aquae TaxID=295108 RepID=A0A0Q9YR76_9GAMM|nr:pyruvate dehydrogenase (acetyl-transferring) E1 component subunit alpha [Candidatus Berkiella aquae]MCS5712390.1 pyruvate dehydrogenase (acetyl-transferring) E1 component subunit alpha [Candidatus Berkiella aquae]
MSHQTTTVAHFDIPHFGYLDSEANVLQPLPAFAEDKQMVLKLYRMMILMRVFDKKAITLQRTGKLGTYPSTLGQEAISVGMGAAMQPLDVLCPYYREYGAQFWRGVKMEEVLLYWGGDERGSDFANNKQDLPICVPIASQTLHAVGIATALKLQKKPQVVVTAIGDGGTSRGDFYEAMNVAGVWNLPVVFVINNNQWAISVPREKQCKAQTLAQKAIAAGLEGWQIDGNDVFAVKEALDTALEKARKGQGATVIEAISYRMGDHTTADDASRYRSQEELQMHEKQDPIKRLKQYMLTKDFWDEQQEAQLMQEITAEVEKAVEHFNQIPMPSPESMFDYLYETLPEAYQSQRAAVMKGENQ